MSNTLIIAKKEFSNLLRDPCILFILAVYSILALNSIAYDIDIYFYRGMISGNSDFVSVILEQEINILTRYGSVIALMIGFSSMSSEQMGNALKTLITKPLYRDTIINGKLLGCLGFLTCVFGYITVFFLSMLLVFYGGMTVNVLPLVLEKLPFLIFISLVYVTIFMLLSMLISTAVRGKGVALMLTILSFFFIDSLLLNINFAWSISILFGDNSENVLRFFWAIAPPGILSSIINNCIYRTPADLIQTLSNISFDLSKLLIMAVVLVALNYSLLLRRDIQ